MKRESEEDIEEVVVIESSELLEMRRMRYG